jgi:hypothetical protein
MKCFNKTERRKKPVWPFSFQFSVFLFSLTTDMNSELANVTALEHLCPNNWGFFPARYM